MTQTHTDTRGNRSDLLHFKRNEFSQNGEDGIIEELFRRIGVESRTCCEFGAWDGIYASNCRALILSGWRALMIEADSKRFEVLVETYRNNPSVTCVNRLVDRDKNSLGAIVKETGFPAIEFLSIDIDGLDYEIFESLDIRPRVICIEVRAEFPPGSTQVLPREVAARIGQPMEVFLRIARVKGYSLVCYTGNAFFVRDDVVQRHALPALVPGEAYESFLGHLDSEAREWLYLTNRGLVQPYRLCHNPRLRRTALQIPLTRLIPAYWLALKRFCMHVTGYLRARFGRTA